VRPQQVFVEPIIERPFIAPQPIFAPQAPIFVNEAPAFAPAFGPSFAPTFGPAFGP